MARIQQWNEDTFEARQAVADARAERRRRFWFGLWTIVGVAAIVALTVAMTASWRPHITNRADVAIGSVALFAGIRALVGRDIVRKR